MLPFLLAPIPPPPAQLRLFYALGFDGRIEEYEGLSPQEAFAQASVGRIQPIEADRLFGFFRPSSAVPKTLESVRLGLFWGNRKLYVDAEGVANYGGRMGSFDVVAFERYVRLHRSRLKRFGAVPLLKVRSTNNLPATMHIRSTNGTVDISVPPGTTRSFATWFTPHQIFVSGRSIGRIPTTFFTGIKEHLPRDSPYKLRQLSPPLSVEKVRKLPPTKAYDREFEIVVGRSRHGRTPPSREERSPR